MSIPGVEQLNRIDDGREELAVRIPVEALEAASDNPAAFALVLASYSADGASDADFRAPIREIIDAPDSLVSRRTVSASTQSMVSARHVGRCGRDARDR